MKFKKLKDDIEALFRKYYPDDPDWVWDTGFLMTAYMVNNDNRDRLWNILYSYFEDGLYAHYSPPNLLSVVADDFVEEIRNERKWM